MAQQPHSGRLIVEVSRSHAVRQSTRGGTPLDEGSARRRGLYLTTHNVQKRQTSILPARFEPTIPASERPQTDALDRAATEIGRIWFCRCNFNVRNVLPIYSMTDAPFNTLYMEIKWTTFNNVVGYV